MVTSTLLRSLSADERHGHVRRAAEALVAGEPVIMPTETLYGIAASGADERALQRLGALSGSEDQPSRNAAWHAPSVAAVLEAFNDLGPLHRRLIARLAPGPASFVIPHDAEAMAKVRERAGLCAGAARAPECTVRIPDHPIGSALLREAGVPVLCARLAATGWGEDAQLSEAMIRHAREAGIEHILDDGPAPLAKPSTVLRLRTDGGYEVVREGVYEARYIRQLLERVVVFVCTGNTCRSPMAAAIAQQELDAMGVQIPTRIISAGLSATPGAPAAEEAIEALGAAGIDLSGHKARPLDPGLVSRADAIYTMTGAHRETILAGDPTAAGKTRVLDPEGEDIPDPIGQDESVYRQTAERLRTLIRRRLEEFES